MGGLAVNHYQTKQAGLTLIEVLVALAIISIALTAVIKAASQNIKSTAYLQNKTIALWVGQNVLNEARVQVLKLPPTEKINDKTEMLGETWYWQAGLESTPNAHIKKISVDVFQHESDANDNASPLINLETYIYVNN